MTKADAQRQVRALRQMTTARGATPAEAETARAKVLALTERWGLDQPAPTPRPRPTPAPGRRAADVRAEFMASFNAMYANAKPVDRAMMEGLGFVFDMKTGAHSSNVKVHRYKDKANWRIEVER